MNMQDTAVQEGAYRVLVIDDSRSILGMLSARLEELDGVTTEGGGSLADARALLQHDPLRFSLAVLDLNLPDAPDGEVVDYVQSLGIPVIVLTGTIDKGTRKSMFDKQVVDYEVKQQGVGIENVVSLVTRLRFYRDSSILVVDDSRSFRAYLEALLTRHGYRVITAADGLEALAILADDPRIVMVITDYTMPEMDGAALVREMRRKRKREELAIIGISGGSSGAVTVPLLKNGASDFIPKPFEVEELYSRVDQNLDMIRYIREAREAANRDFLTKLYNRRYFYEMAEKMYANAKRGNLMLAMAMVDADHFKRINDTYGHDVGDQVLVKMASAIQQAMRESDLLARFGGEEFVCVVVVSEPAEARMAFERIRKVIGDLVINADADVIRVTASIGVSTELGDSLDDMLNEADRLLYIAKQSGRNRVESTV